MDLPFIAEMESLHAESGTSFVVDLFAGDLAVTFGLLQSGVRCGRPWDIKYGSQYDVRTAGKQLCDLVVSGCVCAVALAVPCQSMTLARRPQLRTCEYPYGVPDLGDTQLELVRMGNDLLRFAVQIAELAHLHGAYFSIENPEFSWLWAMPELQSLLCRPGVERHAFRFSEFGTPYHKPTSLVHNVPTLHELRGHIQLQSPVVVLN
eukprot:1171678-Amphidinium_carterae.2